MTPRTIDLELSDNLPCEDHPFDGNAVFIARLDYSAMIGNPFDTISDCPHMCFFPSMVGAAVALIGRALLENWKPQPLEVEFIALHPNHPDIKQGRFVARICGHADLCFQSDQPHQTLVEACSYINKHMDVNGQNEEAFPA